MARPRRIVGRKRREREEPLATGRGPERALGFLEKHTTLKLLPWQVEVIQGLFREHDGRRPVRTAYVSVGRGNGKSTLAAAVATYLLFADGPKGYILVVAGDTAQAQDIVFKAVVDLVRVSPALERLAVIQRREILVPSLGARLQVIPADAEGAHGYHPTAVIFDELHVQPTRDLWDAVSTSMPGGGLLLTLTTAGYDRESIAFEQYSYAQQVLSGAIQDASYFAYICEAPEGADWTQPATWRLANPALGTLLPESYFEEWVRQALESPASQNAFRRLHLNEWTQQTTRWIDMRVWDENGGPQVDEDALQGRACYGGLDLASTQDLSAFVLVFPGTDSEEIQVVARFWCPEARLHDTTNRYRAQYQSWARGGFLRALPGDAMDHRYITEEVIALSRRYRIVDVALDRYMATQVALDLEAAGLTVAGVRTGMLSMTGPTKELERRLLRRKVRHGGHPVLRWNADSVQLRTDHLDNAMPDKSHSQGRIDGIVALTLALDRAMRHQGGPPKSVYDTRGLLTI